MAIMPAGWDKCRAVTMHTKVHMANAGIMMFEVHGLVTPENGREVVDALDAGIRRYGPRAIMADYSRSAMLADPRTMVDVIDDQMFKRLDREARLLSPPAAVLVSAGAHWLWTEYSRLMVARLGVNRGAFTAHAAAWSWLVVQAQVREQELRALTAAGRT
jgi:hypothetical protein